MTTSFYSRNKRASGARQYAQVGLESQILAARPEQLINLLFQGARTAVKKARIHLKNDDIAQRGSMISKAVDIVDTGLKAAVNKEIGGDVSAHLIDSYDLIVYHLLQANITADESHLNTADTMLSNLHDAWNEAVQLAQNQATTVY
ncbi:MAG TPA: flagellar export chaperone FliS [Paenalcaligenes sp.]|nr:flagellar export chaperone FliS [Paenalcaligenes sp.]